MQSSTFRPAHWNHSRTRFLSILIAWLALVAPGLYHLRTSTAPPHDRDNHDHTRDSISMKNEDKIRIFYNLFTNSPGDAERVQEIVNEQFASINPELHDANVSINSIGYRLPNLSNETTIVHTQHGNEDLSLHLLWNYCRANNNHDTKVVYLHSKGSFHPNGKNDLLRRAITYGALSDECANLPDTCNVCSSLMSPLPFPHTPGNMWLARCDYVARLADPYLLKQGGIPNLDDPCRGWGRFYFEHWIHSHPASNPCDLYPQRNWRWGHKGIPDVPFTMDLQKAPRFNYCHYLLRDCKLPPSKYLDQSKQYHKLLYNITFLDESWWGYGELIQKKILNYSDPMEFLGFICDKEWNWKHA